MDAPSPLLPLSPPPFSPLIPLLILMKRGNNLHSFYFPLSFSSSSTSLLTAALRVPALAVNRLTGESGGFEEEERGSRTREGRNGRRVEGREEGGDGREGTER